MKKVLFIFFALISITTQAQVANGTETKQNAFRSLSPQTATTVNYLTTMGTDGTMGRVTPVNVTIPTVPLNYTVLTPTLGAHLSGIDTRLGQISSTTAGLTQRIYFTADDTTVNSVVYFASNSTGKGATTAGSPPALVLADNTKGYFTKDLISIPQPAATIGYAGSYSGNLTVSATPTPVATQQRFTVEVYRTNNLGTPIASGVSGAPVGDLGVTVVAILDSGIINLTAGSITNVAVNGILTQNITINTGERLRYHVSAAKIGAGGGNVTFGVYYGSSYNSYYDVPVAITTDAVVNKSTVVGVTDTDALNTLNTADQAVAGAGVSYGHITDGAQTIAGSKTLNDDFRVDAFIRGTTNKVLSSGSTSVGQTFNLTGTDATSSFSNGQTTIFNEDGIATISNLSTHSLFAINSKSTNQPNRTIPCSSCEVRQSGTGTLNSLVGFNSIVTGSGTGAVTNVKLFNGYLAPLNLTYNVTNFTGLDLSFMPNTAGGGITNSRGIYIGDVFGSTIARGIDLNVTSGTGKHNIYSQGTADNLFNGNIIANGFISGNVNKVLPSGNTFINQTHNITGTDATSQLINRSIINYNEDGFASSSGVAGFDFRTINNKTTNQPSRMQSSLAGNVNQSGSGTLLSMASITAGIGGSGSGAVNNVAYYGVSTGIISLPYNITNFYGLNLSDMPNTAGGGITNSRGIYIGDVFGSTIARGIDLNVTSGTGKHNIYSQGTAPNYFNGNVLIGTSTSNGNALRLTGTAEFITTPTTSAGTYDILTRNTSTGVVEKVASNTYATTASPSFTGTPTAPTATAGTNTTQIATTAFVQEAVSSGTYTPTYTSTANLTGTPTSPLSTYTVVGNIVTVRLSTSIDPTTASTVTTFTATLPYPINGSDTVTFLGSGTFRTSTDTYLPVQVRKVSSTLVEVMLKPDSDVNAGGLSASFTYSK